MYNPEATKLLIVVFICMLVAIAGSMMLMPTEDLPEPNDEIASLLKNASAHYKGKTVDTQVAGGF